MKIPDDPFVQELLPEFVDTWLDDIEHRLPEYIEKKNSQELYRLAHTLKGSCFQFGIDEIANKGIELMGKAKEEDWNAAQILGDEIKRLFKEAKDFLIENGLYQQ
ncbi:MAG: Hpt domain-containing protein [Candidatus Kapaibacteriota bacterium]